jgi:polysaccharide deacetylase family protein (PEP-CTERM system associated)
MNHSILLTFDVEDWFQVENFKQCIPFSAWPKCELRVEKNIHRILDLLDSIKLPSTDDSALSPEQYRPIRATFFVLGWIAERLPHLVREIQARGHEIASHGYEHKLCKDQPVDDLKNDLDKSKKLLEHVTGNPVYGYRAPSFSIDHAALRIAKECGYLYDSSFNSFRLNRRYGQISLTNNGNNGVYHLISNNFYELPISNLKIGNQIVPWGGGGYFRLIPLLLFKKGVEKILKKHGAYLFYLHPWEIDSDQPKVEGIKILYKFRQYINISKTVDKFSNLLENLVNCRFETCYQYLISHEARKNANTL